ncbi:MAG: tRNA (adenosine(37)-N6)-threonylcarbamoyltransferase complex dimerization subunit type 1 TsaB [Salegentibacter sp.]|uniref:tRNA threonylcarbamoyladenosine biosynthesis protein TsaB n=1 Tax=Salegentibacter flavus TaxID=287099 RepID=A0A1I4XPG8_9FLAO|nr:MULTISPECIES: tRNA (adenosine(37)-N6)-threonylcarbamoyltransferase complex dimerization subunit type 1 TsaB [Salegentibacter]MDR9456340.1 tRNA (adenosine(37)-N6)-threonylcarbamoyltransferase complex dimerization subunit type 1 TsaB [Salegentibacter sp.]SFN27303.1 tRNA threonylcarbamoyladenosine biosynthesis protein TsaB [Salegentibacter flavus]
MPNILCLETSSTNCSVAIATNDGVLAIKEDKNNNYSHAEKLHVFIDEILKENNLKITDLDAVAISKGPGSYTGLRIGVSAAKGLCFSLEIPLISISTLKSLARQVKDSDALVIPLLDARRMEVYSAVFNAEFEQIRETRAEILEAEIYAEYLEKGKVVFIGSGVAKFQTICQHPNAIFVPDTLPSAKEMCNSAIEKYKISDTVDVAYFEPYYLKDFKAG